MFLLFSPFSYIFLRFYILFIFSLFSLSNFYFYWSVIEILMLLFMGFSYTLFTNSFSQLMSYFLIQILSSFFILVSYLYSFSFLLTMSFFLKLSMFPFFSWYINLTYRFPNFIFWMVSTFHKLPAMLIIKVFLMPINLSILWISIIFTTFIRGIMILSVLDFRLMLVLSSVGNNSWFILSQICNSLVFMSFLLVYSLSFFFVLHVIKDLRKPALYSSFYPSSYPLSFRILSLSGMPPFPVFYVKMLVIYFLISSYGLSFFFFLFLISNSFMLIGYLQSLIKYFIYYYSSYSHYFLKY